MKKSQTFYYQFNNNDGDIIKDGIIKAWGKRSLKERLNFYYLSFMKKYCCKVMNLKTNENFSL